MKKSDVNKSDFDKILPGNWFVYFLALKDGFYYVGITKDVKRRLAQHKKGKGARVTKAYHPTKLLGVWNIGFHSYEEAEKIEDDFTLEFMKEYGNGVRGGRWANRQQHNIEKLLRKNRTTNPSKRYKKESIKYAFEADKPKRTCTRKIARRLKFNELSRENASRKLLDYWVNTLGVTDATIEEATLWIDKRGFYDGGRAFWTKEQKEKAKQAVKNQKNIERRKRCSRKRALILGLNCLSKKESAQKLLDWWVNTRGFSNVTMVDALWLVTQNGYYRGGKCEEKASVKPDEKLTEAGVQTGNIEKKKRKNRQKIIPLAKPDFIKPKLGVKTGVDGKKSLIKKV